MHLSCLHGLAGPHVEYIELAVALTSRKHDIARLLIVTVEANLTDCGAVSLHFLEGFGAIDVPEGETTDAVTRDTERILPFKLHHCVRVTIEEALGALKSVELPHQQAGIVGGRYRHI